MWGNFVATERRYRKNWPAVTADYTQWQQHYGLHIFASVVGDNSTPCFDAPFPYKPDAGGRGVKDPLILGQHRRIRRAKEGLQVAIGINNVGKYLLNLSLLRAAEHGYMCAWAMRIHGDGVLCSLGEEKDGSAHLFLPYDAQLDSAAVQGIYAHCQHTRQFRMILVKGEGNTVKFPLIFQIPLLDKLELKVICETVVSCTWRKGPLANKNLDAMYFFFACLPSQDRAERLEDQRQLLAKIHSRRPAPPIGPHLMRWRGGPSMA